MPKPQKTKPQPAPEPSIATAIGLITQAANMRAAAHQAPPGARFSMPGPGGIERPCSFAEVLEQANQVTRSGERMLEEIIVRTAAVIAARIHVGQLEVTQKPDGTVHVAPPVRKVVLS